MRQNALILRNYLWNAIKERNNVQIWKLLFALIETSTNYFFEILRKCRLMTCMETFLPISVSWFPSANILFVNLWCGNQRRMSVSFIP